MFSDVGFLDQIEFNFNNIIDVPGEPNLHSFEILLTSPDRVLPDEELSSITTAVVQSFVGVRALLTDSVTGAVSEFSENPTLEVVPLPAALPLMLSGLAGLAVMRRLRRKAI